MRGFFIAMNLLFVHQNFPSQYFHLLKALANSGNHKLVGLGIQPVNQSIPKNVTYIRYGLDRTSTKAIHPFAMETESKVIRGEACARAAHHLNKQGFRPKLICVHPGWGEALYLKEIWPDVPMLCYQEFYYRTQGFDCAFDQELQPTHTWEDRARLYMKNANLLLALQSSSWNVTATKFQRSSFPENWHSRFSVIHDGVDTKKACPAVKPLTLKLPDGTRLQSGMPIVTFVNRRIEPYRGCHTLIRAIPDLQKQNPNAHLVIVGATEGVSYGAPCPKGEWREHFLAEIEGRYDPTMVHFTGTITHQHFLELLRISAAHVYLTYPFVLSWSLLEAMACGCPIVGSATPPVMEVVEHGLNGLLVDFFNPQELTAAITELLNHRERAITMGAQARQMVLERYSLEQCVPRHLALMDLVASAGLQ